MQIKKNEKTNTYWFVVDIGKKTNGKRNQVKRRGFKTKKAAQKELTTLLNSLHRGEYIEPSKKLYKELLTEWLSIKKYNVGEQTFKSQEIYIRKHIIPELGSMPLSKIKKATIQEVIQNLNHKGLAASTVIKIHSLIKSSLSFAVDQELILKNPATKIILPKKEDNTELNVWTKQERNAFKHTSKNHRYYIAFSMALLTGMRMGEILGARWQDVCFIKETITVQQTLKHDGKGFLDRPKTKTSRRTIRLSDNLVEDLKKQEEIINEEKRLAGPSYVDNDLIVCSALGTPVNPSNLRRCFIKLKKLAGVRDIRFHDLRHTHATYLIEKGKSAKVVAERLGHTDVRMTMDTYSHILPTMQDSVVEALNTLFEE